MTSSWIRISIGAGLLAVSFFVNVNSCSQSMPAQKAAFDAASIKPSPSSSNGEDWESGGGRVTIRGYSLRKLIQAAYDLKSDAEVVSGPDWIDKRRFDINAKIADEELAAAKTSSIDSELLIHTMLQSLLGERFGLQVRIVQKEMPVLALVVNGEHPRLTSDEQQPHSLFSRHGEMTAIATTMQELAVGLSRTREVGQRSVVDRTDLQVKYNFSMHWTPDRGLGIPAESASPGPFYGPSRPAWFGVESRKGPGSRH